MSEINDGFGEALDLDTIIESRWVERMVIGVVKWNSPDLPDLAQEARLEMWRTAPKWDGRGTLEGYLHQNARWKVLSILSGSHLYTGAERRPQVTQRRGDEARERLRQVLQNFRQAHSRDPSGEELGALLGIHPASARKQVRKLKALGAPVEAKQATSLDALIDALGGSLAELGTVVDEVEMAYHYGEIYAAVADLSPLWREYVFLRFWGGLTDAEAVREVGKVHWARDVRPVLAKRLGHLVAT